MLTNEYELIELVKNEANIVIYGASLRADVIIDRLLFNAVQGKLWVAVTDTQGAKQKLWGLYVYRASDLTQIAINSVVLISTQEKYHNEIETYVKKLGFHNILRINNALFADMSLRHDVYILGIKYSRNIKKEQFLQYRTMNMLRLADLRDKVRRGLRVRVLCLVTSPAKLHYASIYNALKQKKIFDVSFYFFDEYYASRKSIANKDATIKELEKLKKFSERLRNEGFNIIWGYDDDGFPISIAQYAPDIVFYNTYLSAEADAEHLYKRIVANHLSCFVPYGMHVSNDFDYHFDNDNLLPAWIHFVDTRPALDLVANNGITEGINAVLSGHPMLDDYCHTEKQAQQIPAKCQNGKKLIVYAPHWSIATWSNTSTFHKHWHCILNLLEKYKNECNFVFKPHPRLEIEISVKNSSTVIGIPKNTEYKAYCATWENSPNGFIVTESNGIELFKLADCLITDSYSFIPAWLPADKPCIFLMNPDGPTDPYQYYYDFIRPVIDSYYLCKTEKEIEDTFNDVIIMGNDSKMEERRAQCKNLIHNLGNAGQFIADYIEHQLIN